MDSVWWWYRQFHLEMQYFLSCSCPQAGDSLGEWTIKNISGLEHKLILAKLQPASLYEVEMAARNCAGLGQPAMMTFRTGKGNAA